MARLSLNQSRDRFSQSDACLRKELAELLLAIAQSCRQKDAEQEALNWLEEADVLVAKLQPAAAAGNIADLRPFVAFSMASCLMKMRSEQDLERCRSLLQELTASLGDDMDLLRLKLEFHAAEQHPQAEEYNGAILSFINAMQLTDSNVTVTLHHVHRLRTLNPTKAHFVVDTLLRRVTEADDASWLDQLLTTMVWSATTGPLIPDCRKLLCQSFDYLSASKTLHLGIKATHAAQTLLWRLIEAAYHNENFEEAASWCRLCLHGIFSGCGPENANKLRRKAILCCLGISEVPKVQQEVSVLSQATQDDAQTTYLLFKLALKCQDSKMAISSLKILSDSRLEDHTLLYGCLVETQRSGQSDMVLACLQQMIAKVDGSKPTHLHKPALFRCSARLLIRQVLSEDPNAEASIDSLCEILEAAVALAEESAQGGECVDFSSAELDWFSKNTYNLAVKLCTTWTPQRTLRLLRTCRRLHDLYPTNPDGESTDDLTLRSAFCAYLATAVLITMARTEDDPPIRLKRYRSARTAASDWQKAAETHIDRLSGPARVDLLQKSTTLLCYDLEAAAALKQWDQLAAVFRRLQRFQSAETYAIFIDMLLSSHAPLSVHVECLQEVVMIAGIAELPGVNTLARWIRGLVDLALKSTSAAANEVIERVCLCLEKILAPVKTSSSHLYPAEELQWLIGTLFNHGIDCYCTGQNTEFRKWADKALRLATICGDEGVMTRNLQKRLQGIY